MKKSWKKPDEKPAQPGKDLEPRLDPVNQVAGQGTTAAARRDAHQVVVSQQNFSGPLPPPELLREYQEIMPNLPEIIVQRMMDEMKHRQDMERRHLAMCEGWATGDLQLQRPRPAIRICPWLRRDCRRSGSGGLCKPSRRRRRKQYLSHGHRHRLPQTSHRE